MKTTDSSNVTYLDIYETLNDQALYNDGIHPNATGEQLEADAIYAALAASGSVGALEGLEATVAVQATRLPLSMPMIR